MAIRVEGGDQKMQNNDGDICGMRGMRQLLLTVFGALLLPRLGVLGPKRSKKLILTCWPLALR